MLSVSSSTSVTCVRSRLWILICVTSLAATLGCSSDSVNLPKQPREMSPQEKFDIIIERLQRTIEVTQPDGQFGLRMRRDLTHQIFPPRESGEPYTAEIVIETRWRYESETITSPAVPPADDGEVETAPPPTEPQDVERKTYELAYRDGKWQLLTKLEKDYERVWFESALNR